MTANDDHRPRSGDGVADAGAVPDEESDDEAEAGRFDKYFEYVLDLLSFL